MDKVITDATKPNWDLIWMLLINLTNKVAKIIVGMAIKELNKDGGQMAITEFNLDGGFKLEIDSIKMSHNITTVRN